VREYVESECTHVHPSILLLTDRLFAREAAVAAAREKIFKRFIPPLSSLFVGSVPRRAMADWHDGVSGRPGVPDSRGSQVQRAGSRERVLDRETLTSERLHPTSQGRPRHFVKVETRCAMSRRAAPRARHRHTHTYIRYACSLVTSLAPD